MILVVALPLLAAVVAVVALATLGRRLADELARLRDSLRLLTATAVAADELHRSADVVTVRAVATRDQIRRRLRKPRTGGSRHRR